VEIEVEIFLIARDSFEIIKVFACMANEARKRRKKDLHNKPEQDPQY
jgi:hypothetical protein